MEKDKGLNGDEVPQPPKDVRGGLISQTNSSTGHRGLTNPVSDRQMPQGDEIRKVHPTSSANYRAKEEGLGLERRGDDASDAFAEGHRDPQQIADDNLSQYVTGQPN